MSYYLAEFSLKVQKNCAKNLQEFKNKLYECVIMKEKRYQDDLERFICERIEARTGKAHKILTEGFTTKYDKVLQEASPLIGGSFGCELTRELKEIYGIVGLREQILNINREAIENFITKHKLKDTPEEFANRIFIDFKNKYFQAADSAQQFALSYGTHAENSANPRMSRMMPVHGAKEPFFYNVKYYEKPGNFQNKNPISIIRERRIPVDGTNGKYSERADFTLYSAGIPEIIVECKTEDSGVLASLKDFEFKETYKYGLFKVAMDDGKTVFLFSEIEYLKHGKGKDLSFKWVHYLEEKKYTTGGREFMNIEYLFDELFCQPENYYTYVMDCCHIVNSGQPNAKLVNGRIQQYYAVKEIKKTLELITKGLQKVPYNFEFAHAQRSGKTITMKLIVYMIERSFREVFDTVFMYTPDLQIKEVIEREFAQSGNNRVIVESIESRADYHRVVDELHRREQVEGKSYPLTIYIVNMQKISDSDLQIETPRVIHSTKILNVIDEAHHGQTKQTAITRQKIFPNASNYLFTATGKSDMYAFYFPDNSKRGFSNKFTISNAKQCGITVPVIYLRATKLVEYSEKLGQFSSEIESRGLNNFVDSAREIGDIHSQEEIDDYMDSFNRKSASEIKKEFNVANAIQKLDLIVSAMDEARIGLPFAPKAIVYSNSIADAKSMIELIQEINGDHRNNTYKGYRFGVDFSSIGDICEKYNPGIKEKEDISSHFMRDKVDGQEDGLTIDILLAVDKYQKGFDLPTLLVTFLDTTIKEPARMNQIFTRTATKCTGKTNGLCIDLSLDLINQETFKQSLALYDNQEDVGDNFLDQDSLNTLKEALKVEFTTLANILNLADEEFTKENIITSILYEDDAQLRQKRQHHFFTATRNIMGNLRKIGSPMFFKPFQNELFELSKAFDEFKMIYANKSHSDYEKIMIDTDDSLDGGHFITTAEIRNIISDVLVFMEEHNIRDIMTLSYTGEYKSIDADHNSAFASKKFKYYQQQRRNAVKERTDNMEDYIKKYYPTLCDYITSMLNRISDTEGGNTVIGEGGVDNLTYIENELDRVERETRERIVSEFSGNAFLFWANETGNHILEEHGIKQPDFISFVSKSVYETMKTIFPEIYNNLSSVEKIRKSKEIFFAKTSATAFTTYFIDYMEKKEITEDFQNQIWSANERFGTVVLASSDLFNTFLDETLKYYFKKIGNI